MNTAAEHYEQLAISDIEAANWANDPEHASYLLARAQVYATLAQAAATLSMSTRQPVRA